MNLRKNSRGFSLVETVLALGIFAFCILTLLGLMISGMRSARSVGDETNAVSIANSVFGGWTMQKNKSATLTIADMLTNLPPVSAVASDLEFFFDSAGRQVESANGASLKMFYSTTPDASGGSSLVELVFWWPPLAPTNAAQRRSFSKDIPL
jgi:uncharacterized protein (TIGR02598 family)